LSLTCRRKNVDQAIVDTLIVDRDDEELSGADRDIPTAAEGNVGDIDEIFAFAIERIAESLDELGQVSYSLMEPP